MAWASARLAPTQVVTWGHPSTTGLEAIDYFVSSSLYHPHYRHKYGSYSNSIENAHLVDRGLTASFTGQDVFSEQLLLFESLGFYFSKPDLLDSNQNEAKDLLLDRPTEYYSTLKNKLQQNKLTKGSNQLLELINLKIKNTKSKIPIILCPQHLPKFHPLFDEVLIAILSGHKTAILVITEHEKKFHWKKTLLQRFQNSFKDYLVLKNGHYKDLKKIMKRIIFVDSLSPTEYLSLLGIGDVMIDPFPFGGGVTTLESLAVGTPTITLPNKQRTVPYLAVGMIETLLAKEDDDSYDITRTEVIRDLLIVKSVEDYVNNTLYLISKKGESTLVTLRKTILENSDKIYNQMESVKEWELFLINAVRTI